MSDYIIETHDLTKKYGNQNSVSHLNIHVKKGRIYGLLGRNGAGKTTTMRMLLGLTAPTSGEVEIFGKPIHGNEKEILPRIGCLIESPGFYPNLTGTENLKIFADLRGLKSPQYIKNALEVVNLPYRDKKLFSQYSLGMKQRLAIALAIIHNPELLILDEPTAGLDPKQIIEIRELIADLGKKTTILLSSHILSEIQAVCSRVLVMDHGRILADGSTESITGSGNKLRVAVKGNFQDARAALESLPGILVRDAYTESEPGVFEFMLEHERGADIRTALFEALAQHRMPIYALREGDRSLEEVFLALTQGENDGGAQ